jgi:hypothetical protein
MQSLSNRRTWALALTLAAAVSYYAIILTNGSFAFVTRASPSEEWSLGLGEFDVDPRSVGAEAFIRDGRTYSYFGILPALIRIPFLPFIDLPYDDLTRLSCLLAVGLALLCKVSALCTVYRYADPARRSEPLFWLFLLVIAFSGAQIMFLRPSLYEEPILWAGALSAAFVAYAIRGLLSDRLRDAGAISILALLAGICMLTRISTAIGLCTALALLMAFNMYVDAKGSDPHSVPRRRARAIPLFWRWTEAVGQWRFVLPGLIVLCFLGIAGFINYKRFGDPLTFSDIRLQILMPEVNDRVQQIAEYGNFNIKRIGFGLMYYFFPLWFVRGSDGNLLFSSFQARAIDLIELPPSSFLLTDPVLLLGVLAFLIAIFRRGCLLTHVRAGALALAAGLCVSALLMLIAISFSFRYRMEFYPFFEFCFLFAYFMNSQGGDRRSVPCAGMAVWCLSFVSIGMAQIFLLLNRLSPRGGLSADFDFYDVYIRRVLDAMKRAAGAAFF